MQARPWSNAVLKKVSKHIKEGTEIPDDLPNYDDVMVWYDELVAYVIEEIDGMPWERVLGDRYRPPTGRAKTAQTLQDKLKRMPTHHLPSIQDVAGVRLEFPMTLTEQDAVARRICLHFDQDPETSIDDLRITPHAGYRAVHVRLNLQELHGRVEVQIRTELQGEWANLYEELGDLLGRDIRYGELSTADTRRVPIEAMQSLSVGTIADVEDTKNQFATLAYLRDNNAVAKTDRQKQLKKYMEQSSPEMDDFLAEITAKEVALVQALQSMRSDIQAFAAQVDEGGVNGGLYDPVQQEDTGPNG